MLVVRNIRNISRKAIKWFEYPCYVVLFLPHIPKNKDNKRKLTLYFDAIEVFRNKNHLGKSYPLVL
jgi:hypothetical protein